MSRIKGMLGLLSGVAKGGLAVGLGAALVNTASGGGLFQWFGRSVARPALGSFEETQATFENLNAQTQGINRWVGILSFINAIIPTQFVQNMIDSRMQQVAVISEQMKKLGPSEGLVASVTDGISENPSGILDAAIIGGVGYGAYKGIQRLTGATAPTIAAASPTIAARASNLLSRIPVVGKWLGVAAIGGAALMTASSADASTVEAGSGDITAPADSLAAEGAALGLSIVGTRTAIQAAAPLAASLGVKAIPGIASIYAAGEAIYDTAKYAIRGEFAQAGTRLVAGVGETVAGIGGALTYFTLGTAWREAVRAGGAAIFGEERAIGHSAVVQLGSMARDSFFGAANNIAPAAPTAPARAPEVPRDLGFAMS